MRIKTSPSLRNFQFLIEKNASIKQTTITVLMQTYSNQKSGYLSIIHHTEYIKATLQHVHLSRMVDLYSLVATSIGNIFSPQ